MSDRIPELWNGDRVRVMQTDAMVSRGIANKVGNIIAIWDEATVKGHVAYSHKMCRVQFDTIAETVPASSLMRELNR